MRRHTAVFEPFFVVLLNVVFLNFSTKCVYHKEVVEFIFYLFKFLRPKINSPVSSLSAVFEFSVKGGFSILVVFSVFISFVSVSPSI